MSLCGVNRTWLASLDSGNSQAAERETFGSSAGSLLCTKQQIYSEVLPLLHHLHTWIFITRNVNGTNSTLHQIGKENRQLIKHLEVKLTNREDTDEIDATLLKDCKSLEYTTVVDTSYSDKRKFDDIDDLISSLEARRDIVIEDKFANEMLGDFLQYRARGF